ncbi:CAMK/CAMKL/CHK1 protein kinase [Gymnopilus junonius]|uniref:non-specific serine/threonine protein kinase n=1 Tax=Gymnopilus junonius TaxID=109634 RepID=A0A9P5N9Q3_GYMJU|nr:CAMK/CAMKL/CHK1 protein kinase [Gymnopilus junonius]
MGGVRYPKIVGYELVDQIGGGGFSSVFRAVNIEEHRVAACKLIRLTEETTEKERKIIEKEIRVHSALKHPNVLEFLNAVVVDLKHKETYVPGFYMLLELAGGGDLFDKIAADVGVSEDVAQLYFMQLISGMHYIHSEGVCHRDLKPENLLLDAAGTLKISDFGLSSVFRLKDSGKTRMLTERCGSLPYVAPELNSEKPYHAEPIDAWGVGVILFTLLAGNTPWDEPTKNSPEFRRYVSGEFFCEDPWNRIPAEPLSLIRGLLTVDPDSRMTLDEAFQHPWCIRPSQLTGRPMELAQKLAQSLIDNGDLDLANPDLGAPMDVDEDTVMLSAAHQSQFTQSLMLFSQTQSGSRYNPHLTRFYASLGPSLLINLVYEFLQSSECEYKIKAKPPQPFTKERNVEIWRMRIGVFKGWVNIERYVYSLPGGDGKEMEGCLCTMQRDEGNPLSWRQLWRAICQSSLVEPHVLRKKA